MSPTAGPVAAVDLGTNSTRLLVSDDRGRPLERLMTITRLGAGVDRTGRLAPDAVERTVATLRRYREVMDRHGVRRALVTATSAARDAANREELFEAVAAAVGARPELLEGETEGRLSFAGATAELDPADGPWLVVDIGGGSTELALGPATPTGPGRLEPSAVRSLDMGCVRVTERFALDRPAGPERLGEAAAFVRSLLAPVAVPFAGSAGMVGLAGTVSAAAALDLRLADYDRSLVHHHRLARASVSSLLVELAARSPDDRRRRPGMEAERADVIVGGLVVLDTVMDTFAQASCLVSEADILDGMVMELLARPDRGATV